MVYQGYGKVANQPISPISWAYDANGINPYAYDLDKAGKLLDEAGWRVGADGIRQKTVKAGADAAGDQKLINDALVPIAKDNYRRLGVVLKPQVLISTRCWRSARRATMTWRPSAPVR